MKLKAEMVFLSELAKGEALRPDDGQGSAGRTGNPGAPYTSRHLTHKPEEFSGLRTRTVICLFVVAACVALAYFSFISLARKIVVSGVLYPEAGALGVLSPRDGLIVKTLAAEGRQVAAGDALFLLSLDTDLPSGEALAGRYDKAQAARQTALADQTRSDVMLLRAELRDILARRDAVRAQRSNLVAQAETYVERQRILKERISKLEPLARRGFYSGIQLQQLRDTELQLHISELGVRREIRDTDRSAAQLDAEKQEVDAKAIAANAARAGTRAEILQSGAQVDQQRTIVVRASRAGRVSSVGAKLGMWVRSGANLATILPAGSRLEAELLLPSRAVPFVSIGDRIQVRYEAFPYQQYGVGYGTVREISRYPVAPDDGEKGSAEVLYRIKARLDREYVSADGRAWPLFPGVKLNATIMLERGSVLRRWLNQLAPQR